MSNVNAEKMIPKMEDHVSFTKVDKQDSNTDDEKIKTGLGLGDSVYKCMKMLANKTNLPLVGQLFRGNIVPEFTLSEVAKHHDFTSCWIVVSDKVYDVTEFLNEHPGGEEIIIENAGTDATVSYLSKGHTKHADDMLEKYCIGELVKEDRRYKI